MIIQSFLLQLMKRFNLLYTLIALAVINNPAGAQDKPIWKNSAFAMYRDSIVQGKFTAKALSDSSIVSNYQSPVNLFQSPAITFKFSINRKDNEMKPGVDHHFNITGPGNETPVIVFGKQYIDTSTLDPKQYLPLNSHLRIRVDMRAMLSDFKKQGYFTTYNGTKIYEADFKGLYVAGATEPMSWDFDNLHQRPSLQLTDPDGDGIYETNMILNEEKKEKDLATDWHLSKDISAFPQYKSGYRLSDALYNMAIEEMIRAVEPDSTFRTGKEWAGVWTRDISYSIILSMAYLQPQVAKYSLLRKVKNGKIIQDTGTGGAYPVSTDRMIWASAAWELYKATGDKDWLQDAYRVIKNSVEDDIHNAYDQTTGMVKGESSFLDWREQTYPKWMQPADIFESENLGTNAVHYHANIVLAEMAGILNDADDAKKYKALADQIKNGINKYLWMPGKGYYGQYLYGSPYKILSPRSEALGEALCVLFDIADPARQKSVIAKTPVTAYGISCIYPQIPNIPPYHNNAVWPFVQSFWAMAAAKAENETALLQSISAIYRPAALFLTNKENFVADDGDYKGTQINSSNMLWSLAGNISLVHKILFGIRFKKDGLLFSPFVPSALKGKRTLTNFSYRNTTLQIEVEGFGNKIASFELDGKQTGKPFIPATLTGTHTVKIILANNVVKGFVQEISNSISPAAPALQFVNNSISIQENSSGVSYRILRNGEDIQHDGLTPVTAETGEYSVYQAIALNEKGHESFASEPLVIKPAGSELIFESEKYSSAATFPCKGFSGNGFIEISNQSNKTITIPVVIETDGIYAFDFRYANGNGPVNTENKCAIRTLKTGNKKLGVLVFPQRGNEEWSNWGYSNAITTYLEKGTHQVTLSLEPSNENMNIEINQAMLDYMRVIKIK